MKLSTKEALNAVASALVIGASDYQTHAAAQNAKGNQQGELYAISRAVFLRALYDYIHGLEQSGDLDRLAANETLLTFDQLGDLAAVAGARVRETLAYSATVPGPAQLAVARAERAYHTALNAKPDQGDQGGES